MLMISKALKMLLLSLAIGMLPTGATAADISTGRAIDVAPAMFDMSPDAAQLITTQLISKHQGISSLMGAACCQTGKTDTHCEHCSEGGCETGSCNTCFHCVTALPSSHANEQDAYPAYQEQPARAFSTIYQFTEPRPPRT